MHVPSTLCLCLFVCLSLAQLEIADNTVNLRTHFRRQQGNQCNIFDEASFCQQIVIDQRMSLVAVSQRCSCPAGYHCPNDVSETPSFTQCEWDEERHWNRCRMRCTPQF